MSHLRHDSIASVAGLGVLVSLMIPLGACTSGMTGVRGDWLAAEPHAVAFSHVRTCCRLFASRSQRVRPLGPAPGARDGVHAGHYEECLVRHRWLLAAESAGADPERDATESRLAELP